MMEPDIYIISVPDKKLFPGVYIYKDLPEIYHSLEEAKAAAREVMAFGDVPYYINIFKWDGRYKCYDQIKIYYSCEGICAGCGKGLYSTKENYSVEDDDDVIVVREAVMV